MATRLKARRAVWTCAIVAVTATGAWYGAGLKTQQEAKEASKIRREATVEEQITYLQAQRSALIAKKLALEKKIGEIEAREDGVVRKEPTTTSEKET